MTNPYSQLESFTYAEDCLPGEEQIKPTSPEATKGLMEVWRDTANQLDAEKMRSEKAHKDYVSAHESYTNELQAKLKLQEELRKEKELKKLATQELNGFKEQSQKLRRHRDELAGKVQKARETSANLDEWIEIFDRGESRFTPEEILRDIARALNKDLKASEKEDNNEAN